MNDLIKDGQRYALNRLVGEQAPSRGARLYVISRLIGREIGSSAEVRRAEWAAIRNEAYPHWHEDDWTVSESFRARVGGLVNEYLEKVAGQIRLF